MSNDPDLAWQLRQLERRLNEYHEHLESALEHDRQFQMKATWGIVNALVGLGAFFGSSYAMDHWLHMRGWILGTVAGVFALVAWGAAAAWSDKGREDDLKKLSRLPKWRSSADDSDC
jgi:hypothetical protein